MRFLIFGFVTLLVAPVLANETLDEGIRNIPKGVENKVKRCEDMKTAIEGEIYFSSFLLGKAESCSDSDFSYCNAVWALYYVHQEIIGLAKVNYLQECDEA